MDGYVYDELNNLCTESQIVHMIFTDNKICVEISAWSSVICEIVLYGTDFVQTDNCGGVDIIYECFAQMNSLSGTDNGYRLDFYDFDAEKEDSAQFVRAEWNCRPCNALCERVDVFTRLQTPWEYLGLVARGICCHIEYGVANEAEMGILDLAEFLEWLQGDWESRKIPFSAMREYDETDEEFRERKENEYGIPDIFMECADELGESDTVNKYASNYAGLFRELSKECHEPFWRKIYNLLASTQEGISSHEECRCDAGSLRENRENVTRLIHEQGFEGEYPYFYADEPINGPRLFFSYENSHIAVNHKDAKSFIYCRQQDNKGLAETEIFCGMKLEPKETDDVFSCMFDCGGKSYFSCFTAGTAVSCRAAAKSARLKWLTKEEYAYKHTAAVWNSKGFYIVYFLFGLVLFGAIMTAALMLLAAVLVFAFTGSASDAEECFAATSWVLIFAASGGLYSAVMTACMYIATHK